MTKAPKQPLDTDAAKSCQYYLPAEGRQPPKPVCLNCQWWTRGKCAMGRLIAAQKGK